MDNTRYYANGQRYSFLSEIGSRYDLKETLFYATGNGTDNGVFKGQFFLSDLITQFRISANSFDFVGRLGFNTALITSRKAFYITFNLPVNMVQGDQLKVPVYMFNSLNQ